MRPKPVFGMKEDGFFYDHFRQPDGSHIPVPTRTMVGFIPLFAVIAAPGILAGKFQNFASV